MSWYILTIIPVLGLLVLVHELGHFLAAKWAGIRVEEFGLGFPPALVSIRKREQGGWEVMWLGRGHDTATTHTQNPFGGTSGGKSSGARAAHRTIYSLNLFPIGGFVRMPGETGDAYDENGNYDEESFAAKSAWKRFVVLIAGVVMNFLLAIVLFTIAYSVGQPTSYSSDPVIGPVQAGSPAEQAGLRTDDRVLSVNGKAIHSFDEMHTAVTQVINQDGGKHNTVPVTLVVRHAGQSEPVTLVVQARAHPGPNEGAMGVGQKIVITSTPIWQAPFKGIVLTFNTTKLLIVTLGKMIVGAIPFQVSGPVGVANVTSTVAQSVSYQGWWPLLSLTSMLSLNLAVFNVLPFPALDGGRIALILVEVLRGGKRLRPEREGLINFIGIAILLLLMLVVTVSDIMHWGS